MRRLGEMKENTVEPSRAELETVFRQKHGDPTKTGWGPRIRYSFGYFTPDEYYEAVVSKLVETGCAWIDVGGGRDVFPDNKALATELAARCLRLTAVDPSDTVEENQFAHRRVKAKIEDFTSSESFDLATLRMVAEHIETPEPSIASLARLVKPNGMVVVYTINKWSPVSLASLLTPFWIHHPIKHLLWKTEEADTFPVAYKMNTRRRLRILLHEAGFREHHFAYLDDCRTFHRFRVLSYLELSVWRLLRMVRVHYPENCLLGVYQRNG
jgi:2-polyprenyl-3-methyl-5-hydroxy-6-metoxy-1,4-benzoquinol methylase